MKSALGRLKRGKMIWTGDPYEDFKRWDAEQKRRLKILPICACCRQPIQSERMYVIGNREYCQECIEDSEVENRAVTEPWEYDAI